MTSQICCNRYVCGDKFHSMMELNIKKLLILTIQFAVIRNPYHRTETIHSLFHQHQGQRMNRSYSSPDCYSFLCRICTHLHIRPHYFETCTFVWNSLRHKHSLNSSTASGADGRVMICETKRPSLSVIQLLLVGDIFMCCIVPDVCWRQFVTSFVIFGKQFMPIEWQVSFQSMAVTLKLRLSL